MTKHRYETLDGLRGVAALMVVLTHACSLFHARQWVMHGYLAVDFFFVLSGFVIAHAYEKRLSNGMTFRSFAVARLIRLQPLVLLGVAVGLVAAASAPPVQLIPAAIAGALTLPWPRLSVVGYGLWPLNPPTWSLFWEYAINAAFALILFRLRSRWLVLIGLAGLAGLILATIRYRTLEIGFLAEHAWGGTARVAFSFTVGVLLCRHRTSLPNVPFWSLALALVLVMGAPLRAKGLIDLVAVVAVFPAIVATGAASQERSPLLRWSGDLSYPLYVMHWPVLALLSGASPATVLLGVLAAAWFAYVAYDVPIRAWLQRQDRSVPRPRRSPQETA